MLPEKHGMKNLEPEPEVGENLPNMIYGRTLIENLQFDIPPDLYITKYEL